MRNQDELEEGVDVAKVVASGEELLQAQETSARLSAAYDRLSEPQRVAFELVKTAGLSHAQAATVAGTSVTGIKLRVHRAYVALRAALDQAGDLLPAGGRR
jgi:RNA polymerase sigma-70 factor (ECF subfamily)